MPARYCAPPREPDHGLLHSRPVRRPRTAAALLVAVVLAAGCASDEIELAFSPEPGTRLGYTSTIDIRTARVLADEEVVTDEQQSRVTSEHEVLETADDTVEVRVDVRRDAEPARTYLLRYDAAAALTDVAQVDDVDLARIGDTEITDLLVGVAGPPPEAPLSPGDTWAIDQRVNLPGLADPVALQGSGSLSELGTRGDTPTATVEVVFTLPVSGRTPDGRTSYVGTQTTTSTITYDLDDGTVVEVDAVSSGQVDLLVEPPVGVVGAPVRGTLRYEVATATERTTLRRP